MLDRTAQIDLIRRTEAYLARILGTALHIHASTAERGLPFHIADQYSFFEGPIANQSCLFLVVKPETPDPPMALEKQLQTIREKYPSRPLLLVLGTLDSRSRTRLTSHQIAFVVPDFQLYAPALAMDLRERLAPANVIPKHFSPSAQLLVLAHLLHQDVQEELSSRLAKRLCSTAMSMSRAFAEVEALDLVTISTVGKERRLLFKFRGRALWDKALPYLRSPVRKRRGLPNPPEYFPGLLAGEAALSRYTLLAAPRVKSYAIAASQWKALASEHKLYYTDTASDEDILLETWSYDPAALSQSEIVDPLSLYLSVRGQGDERATLAADELLERSLA